MLDYITFLTESAKMTEEQVKAYAELGEISVVLAVHEQSGSSGLAKKHHKEYGTKIAALEARSKELETMLGDSIAEKAREGAELNTKHLINLLQKDSDYEIDLSQIKEVYHTPNGIKDNGFPSATQQSDPADMLIWYQDANGNERAVGVSLKIGSGETYGNEGVGTWDELLGIDTASIWNEDESEMLADLKADLETRKSGIRSDAEKRLLRGEKMRKEDVKWLSKAKLTDKQKDERKSLSSKKTRDFVNERYYKTQEKVVKVVSEKLNGMSLEKRRAFILNRFHAGNSVVPTILATQKTAVNIDKLEVVQRLRNATTLEIRASKNGRSMSVCDQHGCFIMFEARSTHNKYVSNQFNTKLFTGKDAKWNEYRQSLEAQEPEKPEKPETESAEISNDAPGTDQHWFAPSEMHWMKFELPQAGFRLKAEEKPQETKPQSVQTKASKSKKGATQKPKKGDGKAKGKTVSRAMKAIGTKFSMPMPKSLIHKHLASIDLDALRRDYENPNVSMKQIEGSYKLVPQAIARYAGHYFWKTPEKRAK
jgi:hypothetical protein